MEKSFLSELQLMAGIALLEEHSHRKAARDALEIPLADGEVLLGVTQARLNPGTLVDKVFHAGWTGQRWILVRKDQPGRTYSLYPLFIEGVSFSEGGKGGRRGLRFGIARESFSLPTFGPWNEAACELASQYGQREGPPALISARQAIQMIRDLHDLGALEAAHGLMQRCLATEPVLEVEPETAPLETQISESRLALRYAAWIFLIALLWMVLLAVLGFAEIGLGVLLAALALSGLLRGLQSKRYFALGLGLLNAAANLILGFSGSLPLDVLTWGSFGAALALLLTGTASHPRRALATTLFSAGFIGAWLFTIFTPLLRQPLLASPFLTPQAQVGLTSPAAFYDDFSIPRGWTIQNEDPISSGIENGRYALEVKEPGTIFFAFPPVNFAVDESSFDVLLPEDAVKGNGYYGVVCHYEEDAPNFVMVQIHPASARYSIVQVSEENIRSLIEPDWKDASTLKVDQPQNHIHVACDGQRVTLWANQAALDQVIYAPDQPRSDGRMGIFVRAGEQNGPGGWKVWFDDALFQKR